MKAIMTAVEAYETSTLYFDSPIVRDIRGRNNLSGFVRDEEDIVCALDKIYPGTAVDILSTLAAWLVVDLHLVKTINKSRATILATSPTINLKELEALRPPSPISATFTARAVYFLAEANHGITKPNKNDTQVTTPVRISSPLKTALPETSMQIPSKAREMLGLSGLDSQMSTAHEVEVLRNAEQVRLRVQDIAERLMVAVRGRFDNDLWNCMMILVGFMESCGTRRDA